VWQPFESGGTIGKGGSEIGTIIRDEEHASGARITLERDTPTAPFAITCGVYGWMVHTPFFAVEADAATQFEAMKGPLSEIIAIILPVDDAEVEKKSGGVSEALNLFIKQYP
jgi:hypothetical protein